MSNLNGCLSLRWTASQQLCPLPRVPQRGRRAQRQHAPLVVRASSSGPPPSGASQLPQAQQQQQQQRKQQGQAAAGHVTNVVSTPAGDVALGSFLSTKPDTLEAVQEAVSAIAARLGGEGSFQPELALVFATAAYGGGLEEVVPALRQLVPSLRHVFGCTVSGAGLGPSQSAALAVRLRPTRSKALACARFWCAACHAIRSHHACVCVCVCVWVCCICHGTLHARLHARVASPRAVVWCHRQHSGRTRGRGGPGRHQHHPGQPAGRRGVHHAHAAQCHP